MSTTPGDPNDDVMMSASSPSPHTQQHTSPRFSDNTFTSHLLSIVAAGNVPKLPPEIAAIDANDALDAVFTPFLPLLTRLQTSRCASTLPTTIHKTKELDTTLLRVGKASPWRHYAQVLADLTPSMLQSAAPANSELAFRRFESGSPTERVMIVLTEWLLGDHGTFESSELVMNEIYQEEIAVILVQALASPQLQTMKMTVTIPLSIHSVVRKVLTVPIAPVLLTRLASNDPSCVEELMDALVAYVVESTTENKTMAQQEEDALNTVTLVLENARSACLKLAELAPLYAVRLKEKLSQQTSSLYCVAMTFELLVTCTSPEETSVFMYQWFKRDGALGSAFPIYLQLACQETADGSSNFQSNAALHLAKLRSVLLNTLNGCNLSASRYQVTAALGACVGLQVLGSFPLTEDERIGMLQSLDKLTPSLASRAMSLAFLVIVFLWYPLAPELSKVPGQRDEHLKQAMTLSQKVLVSQFHARAAGAGPLFVVSAVLFYTKAPALVPFLASVIGFDETTSTAMSNATASRGFQVQQALRAEYLHVFGDVVLKSVLTESLLAREILMFPPVLHVSAFDAVPSGFGNEFTLSALHGLLCEKSFLRHHHGHRLERWVATQIGEHAALPVHPLLVNLLLEYVENYVMAFEYPIAQAPRRLQLSIVPLRSSTLAHWLASPCLLRSYKCNSGSQHELAWARGVLGLTYALHFNQRLRHATMVAGSKLSSLVSTASVISGASISSAWGLGADICLRYDLSAYPLRNIATQALIYGNHHGVFEFIAPTLLKLVMEEHPEQFDAAPTRVRSGSTLQLLPLASLCRDSGEEDVRKSWFRRRKRDDVSTIAVDLSVSWKLLELEAAPIHVVTHDFLGLVDRLLPYAVVSSETSAASCQQVTAFCAQLATLYETRVRREQGANIQLMMRLIHSLCFVDALWRQQQVLAPRGKAIQLVTYLQVLEDPSRLLEDAHPGVFRHPALVRLLLGLVRDIRAAAYVHVSKCDPSFVPVESMAGTTATSIASVPQHELLQDCLLVHCLLKRLATLSSEAIIDDVSDENRALICTLLDELLTVDGDASSSSPPRLLLTLHLQGYDVMLVPLLVANVPSMKHLWEYWMTCTSGTPSRSATTAVKPLMDFIAEGADKNLTKWRFRLRVVLSLCAAYLCGDRQSAAMQQALRVVWNKLRHGLGTSDESCGAFIDLLSEVLPWIADACSQNAMLSAELVHFLLKLQRQSGGSSHRKSSEKPLENRQLLDQILHDTYASLLEHF
ncbi:hypothetical protein PsorP6_005105 [Peronosclerospora sorghi]|uniref:Uncharacterized protein n=1 Tax=Peronosclerospora sorghi TaxID=230839 RepID=A0ACC0W4C1_9STRA|nr:hypothetical protein PsorP6_005105 [Peronosclerospora sorghi]